MDLGISLHPSLYRSPDRSSRRHRSTYEKIRYRCTLIIFATVILIAQHCANIYIAKKLDRVIADVVDKTKIRYSDVKVRPWHLD
ncbi:hypothetical protein DSUL_20009 [Desulfovibrionales bacterium]